MNLPLASAVGILQLCIPVPIQGNMSNFTIFEDSIEEAVINFITNSAEKSVNEKGAFLIGLSGGSLATFLGKLKFPERAQLPHWHIFLVDEREVSLDHVDSNYRALRESLTDCLQCHWYPALFDNEKLGDAAENYEASIKGVFSKYNTDSFDLLLLGLGPDGHTCSLFPSHPDFLKNLDTSSLVIPVRDSPKPPSLRISLSPKAIKEAKASAFIITNSSAKAPIIKSIIKDRDMQYPPTIVAQNAHWFLDKISASQL